MGTDLAVSGLDRRVFLAAALAAGMVASGRVRGAQPAATGFRSALSVSPFTEIVLQQSIAFTDGRSTARDTESLQRMFVAHGATEVYARLGTLRKFTEGNADHSVERGIERALLAKKLGLPFNPELGMFAFYGDVTHQPEPDFSDYPQLKLPAEWHELKLAQMLPILEDYGASIATEILATGVTVNYWDLGNEVERGVAGVALSPIAAPPGWRYKAPDAIDPEIGKMTLARYFGMPEQELVAWLSRHLWPYMGQVFAAVAKGIRSIDPAARFSTHLSGLAAYSPRLLVGFYRAMDEAGFRVDQAGVSYYPSSSNPMPDRFNAFKAMVTAAAEALRRPLFVAEYSYPVGPFKFGNDDWAHEVSGYPVSREGQARYLRDLVAWGASSGHLSGVRPWAPDLPVPGWGEMSLFDLKDKTATARASLDSIAQGLQAARKT